MFFKDKRPVCGRIVDIHAHVLPGVDDGAKNRTETLEMLRVACSEGITDIIATPHYKSGRFFTPAAEVEQQVRDIQSLADKNNIPIRLYPGTEIFFRSGLEERLDKGQLATMNGSRYVLVEFLPIEEFTYIRNAMEEIFTIGYVPVLAHVERFQCMQENVDRVRELRGMGCGIQANAGSIAGDFGLQTKRYLDKLLKEGLVDYIGTDAHNSGRRAPTMKKCAKLLYQRYDAEYVEAILHKNAENDFLNGE